ncbi:Tyrosyl-DNA phosphodiesterase [Gracilaria domingensis]|nr:Tyrosyl-DNA phosphodiesterase [Gracilaria domingensis]
MKGHEPVRGAPKLNLSRKSSRKRDRSPSVELSNACTERRVESAESLSFAGFYLLKTIGVQETFPTVGIEDIVPPAADLAVICNYKFDVPWLWQRAPAIQTCRKVLLVHGEQVDDEKVWEKFLESEGAIDRVRFVRPQTPMYGTVHSKAFALFYPNGCRICIHTANMIQQDWDYKTQGAYVRDFPTMQCQSSQNLGNQDFKNQLVRYFSACVKDPERQDVLEAIEKYDFSSAGVALVASIPGVHEGERNAWYGNLRLRSVLQEVVEDCAEDSVAVCQFSSLGSIQEKWMKEEFHDTLFASRRVARPKRPKLKEEIHLVYPTLHQVQNSNEGLAAGASLPVPGKNMHRDHILSRLHKWNANISNKERAMPHIKTFLRYPRSQPQSPLWFMLGSFNLSVAAWGRSLKPMKSSNAGRLKILSYEMGVVFAPRLSCPAVFSLDNGAIFKTLSSEEHSSWVEARKKSLVSLRLCESNSAVAEHCAKGDTSLSRENESRAIVELPVPYRLPAARYQENDTPWTIDFCSMT